MVSAMLILLLINATFSKLTSGKWREVQPGTAQVG
jgi:hypothetical protein